MMVCKGGTCLRRRRWLLQQWFILAHLADPFPLSTSSGDIFSPVRLECSFTYSCSSSRQTILCQHSEQQSLLCASTLCPHIQSSRRRTDKKGIYLLHPQVITHLCSMPAVVLRHALVVRHAQVRALLELGMLCALRGRLLSRLWAHNLHSLQAADSIRDIPAMDSTKTFRLAAALHLPPSGRCPRPCAPCAASRTPARNGTEADEMMSDCRVSR